MPEAHEIYDPSPSGALRQGEVVTDLVQFTIDLSTLESALQRGASTMIPVEHPFAIIMAQDCDLESDQRAISDGKSRPLPNVILCEAHPATELRNSKEIDAHSWRLVRQNKNERYQFLQRVDPSQDALKQGIPELAVDFKRYFTVPTAELYEQVRIRARRRSVLNSPYLQHLATRFHYYQYRVALPSEHKSDPDDS